MDVGVVRVERRLGLRLDGLGVRLVGVLALADGLEDARGVPLGELDLLQRLGIGRAPLAREVEKGRGGVECVGRLSRHLVCAQSALGAIKCLLRKLLDIGLACVIIDNGIVVGVGSLGLLEALEQRLCVVEGVVVGGVEALAYDLVYGMILACLDSVSDWIPLDCSALTPVGNGGLDGPQLVRAVDEARDLGDLERGGERLGHLVAVAGG